MVKISSIFVAFLENMNFNETVDYQLSFRNLLKSEELNINVFGRLVAYEYFYKGKKNMASVNTLMIFISGRTTYYI